MSNTKETELKKAWNLIIDYCDKFSTCSDCIFINVCKSKIPSDNKMIGVSDEE